MPGDLDALIAEAEGLCAKLARDEAHCHDYGTSIDIELAFAKGARTLIPALIAALRQRPGREEVELRLRNLCGLFWLDGAYGNGNRRIPQIEQFLRDLGYGPEGAK